MLAIPTRVIRAAPLISEWIKKNIAYPLIIGPDSESEQWVAAVANRRRCTPFVLEKTRLGDARGGHQTLEIWRG